MDDIQFGDVQEAKPETSLRPDRNAHYAVVGYESPAEREIPVFLDLDVMLDMEVHAASDKTVELGGVLLGGQFHDEEGKPFVVISDSLRAKHYESTKGSFKFTKEAWTEITRERNAYPDDLQMVGWYHTHPDWGVFLSGMDMFICDNFFNRPLDMAYVIDPCRGDRAFFQWTGEGRERCRRQKGFYVIASRYRAAELEAVVASLQGGGFMPIDNRQSGHAGMGAPVINVSQPPTSPQQNMAVLAMLTIQVCLLALLAWKLLLPGTASSETELAKIATQLEQIANREEAARTQMAVVKTLDTVLAKREGAEPGLFEEMTELQKELDDFRAAQRANRFEADRRAKELAVREAEFEHQKKQLEQDLSAVLEDKKSLKKSNDALRDELAALKPKPKTVAKAKTDGDAEEAADEETSWTWYWVGGLALVVAAVGGMIATIAYKPTEPEHLAAERAPSRPAPPVETAPKAPESMSDKGP